MITVSHRTTIIAVLMLAGCADSPSAPQSAQQAAVTACRSRADEVYLRQNRADLARPDTADSPLSSSGLTGFTSQRLGGLHARDTMISDCIRQSTAQPAADAPIAGIPSSAGVQP
jgi:hypothetical protein